MNEYIESISKGFDSISSKEDIKNFYYWLYAQRSWNARTVQPINDQCRLEGDYELKSDLPTFCIGSLASTVIMLFNPGWNKEKNKRENDYCLQSKEKYYDFVSNFFDRYPKVVGDKARLWTKAIGFHLLDSGMSDSFSTDERWNYAHESKSLGGWNLIPFHSHADKLSSEIQKYAWLKKLAKSSLEAAIRCKPKKLIVASKEGYDILRNILLSEIHWIDEDIQRKNGNKVKVSFSKYGTTDLIAMQAQHFSQGVIRRYPEMVAIIATLRDKYEEGR